MACLRWRDITQRLARHLVDRSRWLGAAAPHRSSGRARRESGRVARRTAPRVSAGTHGGSRCDLSRAADVRSRSDRHPAPAYRRRPRCHRSRLDPGRRDLVFSSGGHLGLSRMAKISEVSQSSRTREPEFLPFGERATAISIAGTGRLVYSAQSRDTALYELALLSSAGPPVTPVALAAFSSTFDEQTPHYSPDGQRLAFASTRSGAEEIRIANRDGSNPLQVTSMGGPQCSNPQWSPDGRPFSSTRDERARRISSASARHRQTHSTDQRSDGRV